MIALNGHRLIVDNQFQQGLAILPEPVEVGSGFRVIHRPSSLVSANARSRKAGNSDVRARSELIFLRADIYAFVQIHRGVAQRMRRPTRSVQQQQAEAKESDPAIARRIRVLRRRPVTAPRTGTAEAHCPRLRRRSRCGRQSVQELITAHRLHLIVDASRLGNSLSTPLVRSSR